MADLNKIIKIEPEKKYLDITWNVSNFCNFKCSYCNPGNYSGSYRNDLNLSEYLKNLDIITEKYLNIGYKNFKFFFSGGEPTLWKNLVPIIEHVRMKLPNVIVAVNTNFSRPLSWWKTHGHLFDDVVASFHVEFSDKKKYLNNALYMHDKLNYFSCKMLMHEERFWEIVEFGEELKEKLPSYFIEWTPLFDEISRHAGPWEYKDPKKVEFLKNHSIDHKPLENRQYHKDLSSFYTYMYFKDQERKSANSNEIIINRQNNFEGWRCSIGDSIWIDQRGDISMATCGQVGVIGNILTKVPDVGPKKIICKKNHCVCGTDIMIPKEMITKND